MKKIFTYPLNEETQYVDPRYIGDSQTGWRKRAQGLLDGTYLSWPNLDPVADLGTFLNQLISQQSRFINYLDYYKPDGVQGKYNLSMHDLWRLPICIGRKKLLDSEDVSAGTLVGPNNHVKLTFTNPHTFQDNDLVTIDHLDGTMSIQPPLDFYVEVIDSDSIQLKDGDGNYFRYYVLEYANCNQATGAAPCVFTDIGGHTLTDGTLVKIEGFDGTIGEKNGTEFYVANATSTTFNLAWDAAGTDLLAFTPQQTVLMTAVQLRADGTVDITAADGLFNRTQVIFDEWTYQPDSGVFPLFEVHNLIYKWQTEGETDTPLFLKNIGTPGDGGYQLFLDEDMTDPFKWTTNLLLNDPDYPDKVWLEYTDITGAITLKGARTAPGDNIIYDVGSELFGKLDGLPDNTYTNASGRIYSDQALTTPINKPEWRLPIPYNWFKDTDATAVGNVTHAAKVYTANNQLVDKENWVPVNVQNVSEPSIIGGANTYQVGGDPINGSIAPNQTQLEFTGQTFDLSTYQLWNMKSRYTPSVVNRERKLSDIPATEITYGQFYRVGKYLTGFELPYYTNWHMPRTQGCRTNIPSSQPFDKFRGNLIRIMEYNLLDPDGSTVSNPLYDLITAENPGVTPRTGSGTETTWPEPTSFVLGNGTSRVLITPIYHGDSSRLNLGVGGDFWECLVSLIDDDGKVLRSLTDDDVFEDSNTPGVLGGCVAFNPIIDNGDVDATTGLQVYQVSPITDDYNWFFVNQDLKPGTVITYTPLVGDPVDYVWFPLELADANDKEGRVTGTWYNGWLFTLDGGYAKFDVSWAGTSQTEVDVDSDQVTYYDTAAHTGYTGVIYAETDYAYHSTLWDHIWPGGYPEDGIFTLSEPTTGLKLDYDYSAWQMTTVDLNLVDSTTGHVTEVYTAADSSQKLTTGFVDATQGEVAISTNDPYKYELRNVEIIMPGSEVYTYKDSNNNTAYGAKVQPKFYFNSGATTPTYLIDTGEEYPDLQIGVNGSGYLNGFNMALLPNETTYGRFVDGETICFPIIPLDDEYTPPTVSDAEQQDIWDTNDEWASTGFDTRKEWPYHVSPSTAQITLNSPTIVNKSQNGIKYSRKSSHTKWVLEVEYPPMTAEEFSRFHAVAQAAQGQAVPFYFVLRNKDNKPILWADFMNSDALTENFRLLNSYNSGDTVLMLDGFSSNENDAFRQGELFIGSANENGALHTAINQVDANVYGEAKIRLAYPLRAGLNRGQVAYKNPYHAIVTLNVDDFIYSVDVNGYYNLSVAFDLDGWK